ncbi:MAG: signal peptide peptidase SppA [Rikenellaceae bacterium]
MKFLKIFWATLLACVVSTVVGILIWVGIIGSFIASLSGDSEVVIEPNSILRIELSESFSEAPVGDPLSQIDFSTLEIKPSLTLLSALRAIEAAATDDNIEAVLISPSIYSTIPTAALQEMREALVQFKEKSGKPVLAYTTNYTQSGYYFASAADKVYAQPEGMILWQGMATSTMFYKGLFEKLGISVEVFRPTVCRYKSAVEPYILDKMSPENRAQMNQLISSIWGVIAGDVALSRGLSLEEVNRIADNLECMDVEDALKCRMIDGLIYQDQIAELFREAGADIGDNDNEVNYIDFGDYAAAKSLVQQNIGADKVAIIYAEGAIVDGVGYDAKVYGDATAKIIRDARYDDDIKAVVLRVNSPGGSALASDVMWRELELLRAEKPLIVSMSNYAASGGYYISAPADIIIANPVTITGSIGVYSMIPNVEAALKSKVGITYDGVETNSSADFLKSMKSMNQFEKRMMVKNVDKVYTRFTGLVSEGRNLPLEDVLEIAQGRVWSGNDAVGLGLADRTGGLRDAVAVAVDRAGIADHYRIVELMGEPTGIAALFSSTEAKIRAMVMGNSPAAKLTNEYTEIIEAFEPLKSQNGMIMYSPYRLEL